MSKKRCKISV